MHWTSDLSNYFTGKTECVVELVAFWGDSEALGNVKADGTKMGALLFGIKEVLPQVFIQLTTHPGMAYDDLKQAALAS